MFNIHTWAKTDEQLTIFGDSEMAELSQLFVKLLLNILCKVKNILPELDILKIHMLPVIKNSNKAN